MTTRTAVPVDDTDTRERRIRLRMLHVWAIWYAVWLFLGTGFLFPYLEHRQRESPMSLLFHGVLWLSIGYAIEYWRFRRWEKARQRGPVTCR